MNEQISWDFFISYSRSSNINLITNLINSLENYGFNVWYDKIDVILGCKIYENIENVIKPNKIIMGMILFLDKSFFEKEWCLKELQLAVKNKISLLPIMYNITKQDLPKEYAFLKNINICTINQNIEYAVDKILYFYVLQLKKITMPQQLVNIIKENEIIQKLLADFTSSYNKNNVILCDNLCTGIKIVIDANKYSFSKELTILYNIIHISTKEYYNKNLSDFRKKIVLYATIKFIEYFFSINF